MRCSQIAAHWHQSIGGEGASLVKEAMRKLRGQGDQGEIMEVHVTWHTACWIVNSVSPSS